MAKASKSKHRKQTAAASKPRTPFPSAWVALGIYFGLAFLYFLPAFLPGQQI